MSAHRLLLAALSVSAIACSSEGRGDGAGAGGAGGAAEGASTSTATATSSSSSGDASGGAPGTGSSTSSGLGECISEVSVVGGSCVMLYECAPGSVRVECSYAFEGEPVECSCFIEDVLVASCMTDGGGEPGEVECDFPDSCCREALDGG